MAVFLINICKFNGCGITFPSLGDLIQHIEDTHIDYDPQVIEQKEQSQPACLPLSYVLRFITDAARKEGPFLGTAGAELKRKLAIKHHSYSLSSSNRSNTPTGSELDEDEMMISESEDSNESWTTEGISSEFIMRYGSRHSGTVGNSASNEKPFACPVPGCKKRYKNVNGIKYHSKNGHKKDGKVRKGYKCHCGKSYKTSQGLKTHTNSTHNSINNNNFNLSIIPTSPSQNGSYSPTSTSNISIGSNFSNNQNNNNNNNNNNLNNNNNINNNSNSNNNNTICNITNGQQFSPNSNCSSSSSSSSPSSSASALSPPSSSSSTSSISSPGIISRLQSSNGNNKNNFGLLSINNNNTNNNNNININNNNNNNKSIKSNSVITGNNSPLIVNNSTTTTINTSTPTTNGNKLVKLLPDTMKNNLNNTNYNNSINNNDIAGVKMNLPSLVNVGVLTPATSPKLQAQLNTPQQQQQQPQQHHMHQNMNGNNYNNNNSNNNNIINNVNDTNGLLPLTPISPILNKSLHFNHNNNNNINNQRDIILNSDSDNTMTDET